MQSIMYLTARYASPRDVFLCNRDGVSYYTKKKTDACMLRTHHLPCHILIVILYVICPTCCKTIIRVYVGIFASKYLLLLLLLTVSQVISLSHTIRGVLQSFACSRHQLIKFELLTQSITWISPPSAAAPPVRMGLTNLLVGNILHEKSFRIHVI